MTMTASIAVIPAVAYAPNKLEVALSLKTLAGSDNPLAAGGRLERSVAGGVPTVSPITSHTTVVQSSAFSSTTLPSSIAFVLEAPTGKRLLELSLEVLDYTSSWDHERVDVRVTAKGVSAQVAPTLTIDAGSYSWRLSATAVEDGTTLELTFELVQEEVPTDFVDALASTRLAFLAGAGGSTQQAVVRPKRHKETLVPT